ncbi:MAG: hypothetical protein IKN39_04875 [Clostridia bacterium]|nr:hypothetical protein [Clostridia bacterium]
MFDSKIYNKEIKTEAVLSFSSFDGGGPSYNVKIEDESVAAYNQMHYYLNPDHNEMCGSGYEVNISFVSLKPGKTRAIIECRSSIADNYDAIYDITVDENMGITVTKRERKNITRP